MQDLSSYDLVDVRAKLSRVLDIFMAAATDKTARREEIMEAAARAEHACMIPSPGV